MDGSEETAKSWFKKTFLFFVRISPSLTTITDDYVHYYYNNDHEQDHHLALG